MAADEVSNLAVDVLLTKSAIHQVVGSPAITNAALVHLSDFDHFTVQVLDDDRAPKSVLKARTAI